MKKTKRIWSLLLIFLLVLNTLSISNISYAASEGIGTKESPYIIKTCDEFYTITQHPGAYYRLVNDLDFKNAEKAPMGEFRGFLYGEGHTISNLRIVSNNPNAGAGLFSTVSNSIIRELNVTNISVNGASASAGAIAGLLETSTLINCTAADSQIISTTGDAGGLVGKITWGVIDSCESIDSTVKGVSAAGGIIGRIPQSRNGSINISRCYSNSYVESSMNAGGLIGHAYLTVYISKCFTGGTIKGNNVGGIIGYYYVPSADIENCYSVSNLTGSGSNSAAGGLIGKLDGNQIYNPTIKTSYFAGQLSGTSKYALSSAGTITNSYFDKYKTGLSTPAASARTTAQMYQQSNYSSWDFNKIWSIEEGKDYPKLILPNKPVRVPLESISLQPGNAELMVGESLQITPVFTPVDAADKTITWTSSNPSVAVIDNNGLVQAIAAGYSTIIAVSNDGNHMAYCGILVKEAVVSKNIAPEGTMSSNCVQSDKFSAEFANDNDHNTRWMAEHNEPAIYLEIDFAQKRTFRQIKLFEMGKRIDNFVIEIWKNDDWVEIYEGNRIGEELDFSFSPVTSEKVRLVIYTYLNANRPSIYEFEVYE